MKSIWIIAWAGFTEARRNRVTLIVVAFALVMLLSTTTILNLTVFTLDRVATDFGLGVMSILMVGLAIFLSTSQLSREIDRRTIFLVLSRPLSRAQFVLGRVLGTLITLWVMLIGMAALFFLQAWAIHIDVTEPQFAAVGGLAIEMILLTSIGAVFSSVSGPMVASLSSIGIYLIGHGATDLWEIAARSQSEAFRMFGRTVYWVVPQLDRLDFRLAAAYATPINWSAFGGAALYALGYSAVLLTLAVTTFDRVDFK